MGDYAGYWAVIAQIIPVLALALVLEARLLARRLSKKKAFAQRRSRTAWGVTFLILAVLLWNGENYAIQALLDDPEREVTGWTLFNVGLAYVGISASLFVIFYIPVMRVGSGVTLDAARAVEARVPWSAHAKGQRKLDQLVIRVRDAERNSRDASHQLLVAASEALTDWSKADRLLRATDQLMTQPEFQDQARQARAEERAGFRQGLEDLREMRQRAYAAYESAWSLYVENRAGERDIKKIKKECRKLNRRLAKLRRDGGTKKDFEAMRRSLAKLSDA